MDRQTVATIHTSLINGNRRQMVAQIDETDLTEFWNEYYEYLIETCRRWTAETYYRDAVVSYFRIKGQ